MHIDDLDKNNECSVGAAATSIKDEKNLDTCFMFFLKATTCVARLFNGRFHQIIECKSGRDDCGQSRMFESNYKPGNVSGSRKKKNI